MNRRIFLLGALTAPYLINSALAQEMNKITTPSSQSLAAFHSAALSIFDRTLNGELEALDANHEMFDLIRNGFDAFAFLALVKSSISFDDLGFLSQFSEPPSREIFELAQGFEHPISDYQEKIGRSINRDFDSSSYVTQIDLINDLLIERFSMANGASLIANHHSDLLSRSADLTLLIVDFCKKYLGFNYTANRLEFDVSTYWPDQYSYSIFSGYADLYRGDNPFSMRNVQIVSQAVDFSDAKLMLFYAWMYSPSFERFLAISEVPNQLPPWISEANPRIQEIHLQVNSAVMEAFRKEQSNMEGY